jgi:hypothetical protein
VTSEEIEEQDASEFYVVQPILKNRMDLNYIFSPLSLLLELLLVFLFVRFC